MNSWWLLTRAATNTIRKSALHGTASKTIPALYTVSTKKQSPTISNIILFGTDEFYKIWKTYSESTQDTTAVAFPIKPVKYPYLRCFILMTSCRMQQRLLVEWRQLDHSIVVTAINQWCCRLSVCVRAHGGHFKHILWCFYGSLC